MTQDQKETFFEAKKTEMQEKMKSHKAVIDKLIAGEALTADEELIKEDIKARLSEDN